MLYNSVKDYYKITDMQIYSSKINQLKKLNDLKPCYLYISKSSSILDDRVEALKKFLRGKINFEVDFKVFYGNEDIDEYELVNFYKTPSFFSEKKVAVIKNFEKVQSSIIQTILGLLNNTDIKNYVTVIIITTIKQKIDSELLKRIEKIGQVERLNIPVTDSLKKWLDERCELDGLKFTGKAAAKLIENVNFDLNLLKIEYEKLYTFIIYEKDKIINERIVDKLVNRVYDMKIFDLVDFIGDRDKGGALRALKSISVEKQNIIGLITLIHRMFKAILFIKNQSKRSYNKMINNAGFSRVIGDSSGSEEEVKNYIKRYIGHSPYLLGKIIASYKRFAKKYSSNEIIKIIDILNKYDFILRTSEITENYIVARLIADIVDVKKIQEEKENNI